ncbi:MAG TPA: hypothetical protein VIG98_11315 [Bacillus sp. (in: firmicutes)]|jgi:hypothetical protein
MMIIVDIPFGNADKAEIPNELSNKAVALLNQKINNIKTTNNQLRIILSNLPQPLSFKYNRISTINSIIN